MSSSTPSSPSASLGPSGIMAKLRTRRNWTSEDLEELLNKETVKQATLQAQKDVAEEEADRLTTEGKRDLKGELEHLNKAFTRLKSLMSKMTKEKLPNRIEHVKFYQGVEKAEELEKAAAYLTVLKFYTATSEQIDANLESDLEGEAIELFHRLKMIEVAYLDITDCGHLTNLGKGIVAYWETKLTNKLVRDFEKLLESFGWPMRLKTATPTLETHEKLHRSVMNMSRISCTDYEGSGSSFGEGGPQLNETEVEVFAPILPIQVMMVALKRRFRYHFLSDKATNETSKPEWYFSQVKQWVYDLVPFVKTHLEQVTVSEIGVSSVIEFIRCISEMLTLKVEAHLNDDSRDVVFVKILEESISFENEISEFIVENVAPSSSKSYLPAFVNAVFSSPPILQRWLEAEKRACQEKLDDMFSSPSAWNKPIIPGPPEIVDLFIAVIRSLTDRFAHLRQLPQRLQFLHLLNDLLEEFHVRCLQTWKGKPEQVKEDLFKDVVIDFMIADSLYSIHDILQDWEYLPFFASLTLVSSSSNEDAEFLAAANTSDHSGKQDENEETLFKDIDYPPLVEDDLEKGDGLFASACSLYWCLADEIQTKWCLKVIRKVKEELQPYAKLKWQSFQSAHSHERISEQILRLLQTLRDLEKALTTNMDPRSAEKWMKKLAVKLDEVLMETMVFPHQFSRAGVSQLYYDFTKGIFPLFSECGVNEKLFFGSVVSALTILRISTGEAMLLYDTLMNGNFEAHEIALAELGISICQSEVIKILRNRCDLRI